MIDSLEDCSVSQWGDRTEALATKFESARIEAAQLLQPKLQRVSLPKATFENEAEIKDWLKKVEQQLIEKLKDGPVMITQ